MRAPIPLADDQYWKLKSRFLDIELQCLRFDALVRAKQVAALKEAGLDPGKAYEFDDSTLTVVEQPPA